MSDLVNIIQQFGVNITRDTIQDVMLCKCKVWSNSKISTGLIMNQIDILVELKFIL